MRVNKLSFIAFLALILIVAFTEANAQVQDFSYAYIEVRGRIFSKKLKVDVDLGDTRAQLIEGKRYSEILTNNKSYAAILNYMVDNQFELVQALDYIDVANGTGGTSGIVFIMKKRK